MGIEPVRLFCKVWPAVSHENEAVVFMLYFATMEGDSCAEQHSSIAP